MPEHRYARAAHKAMIAGLRPERPATSSAWCSVEGDAGMLEVGSGSLRSGWLRDPDANMLLVENSKLSGCFALAQMSTLASTRCKRAWSPRPNWVCTLTYPSAQGLQSSIGDS